MELPNCTSCVGDCFARKPQLLLLTVLRLMNCDKRLQNRFRQLTSRPQHALVCFPEHVRYGPLSRPREFSEHIRELLVFQQNAPTLSFPVWGKEPYLLSPHIEI